MGESESKLQKYKALAVIAGDIHYSLQTLEAADKATRLAIDKANELNVPFIANGDTHDTKANLRAECVNALIETFKRCKIKPYINIGNHCKINEKSQYHALNFLSPYANIIATPTYIPELASYIIPYHHDLELLRALLRDTPSGSRLIMHQGIQGSNAGEYTQDKTALNKEDLTDFRTILSHYHNRQDIKCGRPRKGAVGLASYIGNLYTLNFGEANDPPKGFQILMDDGTLEFVPTNLRKHLVFELEAKFITMQSCGMGASTRNPQDLVWVKVKGTKEELSKVTKTHIKAYSMIEQDFRLELIPTDTATVVPKEQQLTDTELLDSLIDNSTNITAECKERLKSTWKTLVS